MKNKLYATLLLLPLMGFITLNSNLLPKSEANKVKIKEENPENKISAAQLLYNEIGLQDKCSFEVFELALQGQEQLKDQFKKQDIITIVDFTLPSSKKRMYVIDLSNKKLLFHTIVAHGENSGDLYATNFSNINGSHQSSLGFYRTENTYQGRNGYSLVINGLEKGINDQAKSRYVVIHGADYSSEEVIRKTGRLGRSQGCPAIPRAINTPVINAIKDGSMLFIYAKNQEYFAQSLVIKNQKNALLADKETSSEQKEKSTIN